MSGYCGLCIGVGRGALGPGLFADLVMWVWFACAELVVCVAGVACDLRWWVGVRRGGDDFPPFLAFVWVFLCFETCLVRNC